MKDDLNRLLQEWQPQRIAPTDIRASVWQRIERKDISGWSSVVASVAGWFEKPWIVATVVVAAMSAGIVLGSAVASDAQTQNYLQNLSVFQNLP